MWMDGLLLCINVILLGKQHASIQSCMHQIQSNQPRSNDSLFQSFYPYNNAFVDDDDNGMTVTINMYAI